MGYGVINADLMTTSDGVSSAGLYGFKNRLINGDMRIDQRNAGASVTPADAAYTLDRWRSSLTAASKFSIQQNAGSVTPPAGFTNYLGVTSLSAYSIASSDIFMVTQRVEGYNVSDLAWGTASAATVTLSFWVRSSLTGTFGGSLTNGTGRSYPFTYTINSANTWEKETITITGDTSGTWLTTNGIGLICAFGLGVGSTYSGTAGAWTGSTLYSATGATSVVGTNGATFYITGVQLEKGTTATSFDYRPYGTELALCQRYLPAWNMTAANQIFGQGQSTAAGTAIIHLPFKVSARVAPTGITASAAANFYLTVSTYSVAGTYSSTTFSYGSTEGMGLTCATSTGLTAGNITTLASNSTSAQILATGCEL
jgi:hypothetical protein